MKIYKIIKQISINDRTGKRKERYVVIQTYTTWIERVVLYTENKSPFYYFYENQFDTLEEARECKKRLEKPPEKYTHWDEVIE